MDSRFSLHSEKEMAIGIINDVSGNQHSTTTTTTTQLFQNSVSNVLVNNNNFVTVQLQLPTTTSQHELSSEDTDAVAETKQREPIMLKDTLEALSRVSSSLRHLLELKDQNDHGTGRGGTLDRINEIFPSNSPGPLLQESQRPPTLFDQWLEKHYQRNALWDAFSLKEPAAEDLKNNHKKFLLQVALRMEEKTLSVLWIAAQKGQRPDLVMRRLASANSKKDVPVFSFFFPKEEDPQNKNMNTAKCLFATIAKQLKDSAQCQQYGHFLNKTFNLNNQKNLDELDRDSLYEQFATIFLDPWNAMVLSRSTMVRPMILIEGLDRCAGDKAAREVASFILRSFNVASQPATFVISSETPALFASLNIEERAFIGTLYPAVILPPTRIMADSATGSISLVEGDSSSET